MPNIKTEIKEYVAKVILNRSEVHNALSPEMISELTKIFLKLDKDKSVKVVILEAEGKSFCAGADLNYMSSMINATYEENLEDASKLGQMFKTIFDCSKPVIGKIQGSAFGGGVGLISVCDIAISVSSAIFALSESKIGLVPGVISPFLVKKVGFSNASRYFITSERFDSHTAKEIGLISEVLPGQTELEQAVGALTKIISQNGPEAVSACKKLIRDVSDENINVGLEISKKYIAECRVSKEGQEGIKAFFEKRSPNWIQ